MPGSERVLTGRGSSVSACHLAGLCAGQPQHHSAGDRRHRHGADGHTRSAGRTRFAWKATAPADIPALASLFDGPRCLGTVSGPPRTWSLRGKHSAVLPTCKNSDRASSSAHREWQSSGTFQLHNHWIHHRKTPLTWSPLTESNRRPSPYHGLPGSPCNRRIAPEQASRWLTLAAASRGKPSLAAFCPPKCPRKDLLTTGTAGNFREGPAAGAR
jgi:hypothetical protein